MARATDPRRLLSRLFERQPVADLDALRRALSTPSRTTVFRALSSVGYRTSYSHAGRFYTLADIPRFDEGGLWAHGDALFSRDGTLRATIIRMVEEALAGRTHAELQERLRLRVHDTLHDLVHDGEIGRALLEQIYLYVAAGADKARSQVAARRRQLAAEPVAPLPQPSVVIEVLLAVVRNPGAAPDVLAARLARRGDVASRDQVDAVFAHYRLGEKKRQRSRRSRP